MNNVHMHYTNPFRRFLFRKDVLRRFRSRLATYRRRITKDEMTDLACLFKSADPSVIFDVGANVGFVTWEFAKKFKKAQIYALEPDPVPSRVLESTHGATPRIHLFPIAAAEKRGELLLYQRPVSTNSSLMHRADGAPARGENVIKVETVTLDSFCEEHSVNHIDLLKTDTEGADLLVLRGASGLLQSGRIDVIMAEAFFVPTYKEQATLDEIVGFLRVYGFIIFNVYIGRESLLGQASYGNIIFISPRFQSKLATT